MSNRRTILALFLFAVIVLLFFIVLVVNYREMMAYSHNKAIAIGEREISTDVSGFTNFLVKAEASADLAAVRMSAMVEKGADAEQLLGGVKGLAEEFRKVYGNNYKSVYVGRKGLIISSLDMVLPPDYDATKRDWYKKAIMYPGKSVLVPPYNGAEDGSMEITVSHALGDKDGTVLGIDIVVSQLAPFAESLHLPGALFSMIVASNGFVIRPGDFMNHDGDISLLEMNKIAERLLLENQSFFYNGAKKRYLVYSAKMHDDWRAAVVADAGILERITRMSRMRNLMISAVLLGTAAIFVWLVIYYFRNLLSDNKGTDRESIAQSRFLFNMSHDIRTPMNAIIGFTNLALEHVNDTEKVKDYLKKAAVANENMLALLNDILDMSRIQSGNIRLEEDRCDIKRMLSDCDVVIRNQALSKKQTFVIDSEGIRDTAVICDRLRLQQVLVNLAGNAVKYTGNGGEIRITARQIRTTKNKADYEFAVKDNGIGMSQEQCGKLFRPLDMDHYADENKNNGMGLGLAITSNIVKLMGGFITVESEPGKGSLFTVCIPLRLAEGQAPANEAGKQADADGKAVNGKPGKRILLVEDNEINKEMCVELLNELGYSADTAANGRLAVEKLRLAAPGTYSIVLMDVQMPVMDGYEATRVIRKMDSEELSSIPIIAMTANAFDEDRAASLASGMNEHLTKPIKLDELSAMLKKFI